MIKNFLVQQIKEFFPYEPTIEQEKTLKQLADFHFSGSERSVLLLNGYAGTGKTSLMSAYVRALLQLKQKLVLLAPTGRAAKVFSAYSGHTAYTIHKKIYRQQSMSESGGSFSINDNLHKQTLFIVDEASMISNDAYGNSPFGTGRLLDDLITYVYSAEGCRLILLGDTAQLPPVGEEFSSALSANYLSGYGLEVWQAQLTEVVRQEQESGILWNATRLRKLIAAEEYAVLPNFHISGFADVMILSGDELVDNLSACYDNDGMDQTIVICRSNKRANIYNQGIRGRILWREEELEAGDMLMVTKNSYFWTEKEAALDFIANGEMARVVKVRGEQMLYGFRFVDVTLAFPDYDNLELTVKLLLDTLHSEAPSLTYEQNEQLYNKVMEDYADVPLKRDRMKKLKADPYFNALQVKYAYAVTCHKAQGGQWKNVFLDQAFVSQEYLTPDFFRWLYTAVTRTTGTLYLVNYPISQTE